MLWDLFGEKVGQLCCSWSTCVKLAWDLPRSTHTYLVEDVLAKDYLTVKQQLVGRYTNFFRSLLKSKNMEICVVANMVGRCAQSTTGGNLIRVHRETGQDPWKEPAWKVRDGITRAEVPPQEGYRVQYLRKLITARSELRTQALETTEVDGLIES